jgi:DNA polymerase-3 subunit delta'
MNNMEIYIWQLELWQRIRGMRERMPHAVMLHGRRGIGKLYFAQALARALLCESPDELGYACGICPSCGWLAQGNHPDFRFIRPEDSNDEDREESIEAPVQVEKNRKKSRFIVIDQIRALGDLVSLSAHRHGLRIVILSPAEALNTSAANALLKMLEEPPPATLFLLVTHQLQRLLPTIRSRCLKIAMPMPSSLEASSWLASQGVKDAISSLAFSGGSPLTALEADTEAGREAMENLATHLCRGGQIDPFELASHWGKNDFGNAIASLQKWCSDLLLAKFASRVRFYPGCLSSLQAMAKSVDLPLLLDFQRKLNEARSHASHPLNTELQLESLLVRYAQLFPGSART